MYDVSHSSKTPLPDTVVRHFWKTLTNDASSFGELMTKQNYSHHRHVVLYYAILLSSAIHEFAWIPQNHHIGSVRVVVWPRNVKLIETVKQISMLSKVPASMAPNELPHWSPRSNGCESDRTKGSIWLHYSISTWGPLQTLKKSSKCALH